MMNKVLLIGHLGADPVIRYMPNGSAVANLNIATTQRWNDKQTGEKKEATEWNRVVFYGRQAEICGEYLAKGSLIYIEGRKQTRKYEKDGIEREVTEIIGNEFQMLGSRQQGDKPSQGKPATASAPSYDDFDDDIQF